jgi:hypothetical protein
VDSLFEVKRTFFDSKTVVSAVDRAERRVLSKFGAYVRRTARSSIRNRKRISRPGEPPSGHSGVLRRFLFFGYDRHRASVVIGPAKTNQLYFDDDYRPLRGTVPEVLEHGGSVSVIEEWIGRGPGTDRAHLRSFWVRVDHRRRYSDRPKRRRKITVAARPFMGPSLAKEQPKLPDMWQNSVK